MVLRVREATPGDAPALAVAHVAAWQAGYVGQVPADYLASLSNDLTSRTERMRTRLEESKGSCLVAVDDEAGELFGFTTFGAYRGTGEPETTGELWSINLRPEAWGKGIGAALLQSGMDGLRAAGYRDAVLWVLETNVRARRFYEKHGWKPDGHTKVDQRETFALHEVRYATPLG